MIREKMLQVFKDLPYAIIWPDSSWDDISGTERELWINSEGYGYFMCGDASSAYWKGTVLEPDEWDNIKNKIEKETLSYKDIKGTKLEELLISIDYVPADIPDLNNYLKPLLNLKNGACGYIYAMQGNTAPFFFDNEDDFREEYERDWADVEWEDMDDELLNTWINRLSSEDKVLHDWIIRNKLNGADRT